MTRALSNHTPFSIPSGLTQKEEEFYLRTIGTQVLAYFVSGNGAMDPSSSLWLLDREMFLCALVHSHDFLKDADKEEGKEKEQEKGKGKERVSVLEMLFDIVVMQLTASVVVLARSYFHPNVVQFQRIAFSAALISLDIVSTLLHAEIVPDCEIQMEKGFFSVILSSPKAGSFLASVMDLWGMSLDYFHYIQPQSVRMLDSFALTMAQVLQTLSHLLLSSNVYELLFCGDGQRVLSTT